MSLKKRIIINAGSNWAGIFFTIMTGLILVPVMWHSVGRDNYGVWALLARGLSYVAIFDQAFSLAINRFVAYYHNKRDERNTYITASTLILSAMAILTITIVTIVSFFISDIFRAIPKETSTEAQITCILVGLTFACKTTEANFSGVLMGYQYYTKSNLIKIISNIIRIILTIVILQFWKSIIAIQLAFLTSALLSAAMMIYTAFRTIPELEMSFRLLHRKAFHEMYMYIKHSLARSGSSILMFNTLTLLVGWKGQASDVAIYDIASRIPLIFRGVLAATQNVFLPIVTTLSSDKRIEVIKAVVKRATTVSSSLTYIGIIPVFFFTGELINFWLREQMSAETVLLTRLYTISVIPGGLFEVWLPTLVGIGHLTMLTIVSISAATLAIAIGFVIVQFYPNIPVTMAPAIALIVTLWLRAGIWLPAYGVYKLGINKWEYIKESIGLPLAAATSSTIILYLLGIAIPEGKIHWMFRFLLSCVILALIFGLIPLRKEFFSTIAFIKNRLAKIKR
jgi:O-antigen/teichoic acid export membrane protein